MKKQRHTYKFNPHTLRYEKVIVSMRERIRKISFNVLFGIVLGVAAVAVAMQFVESPKERSMRRELAQYRRQTRLLTERVGRAEKVLEDIEERDDNLYRTIFSVEPVSQAERHSGIGGVERYAQFDGLADGGLVRNTTERVDHLTKRLYVESLSLDSLYNMARTKTERLRAMPAIMPVEKDKARVVSGFGMRFHPILRSHRLHSGIDFAARQGTPIYATGDGVVKVAGRNAQGYSGYGVVVVIDHGYGFQTLYAHMLTADVRAGKHVKRGEKIGTVGSTGMSTGAHLHYEVMLGGKKVDPVYYFFNDLSPEEYNEVLEQAREESQMMD